MIRPALHRLRVGLSRRFRRGPVILMYHRIGAAGGDPWGLAVSPEHFREHLDVLTRRRSPMSLTEMVRRHAAGCLPPNAAVITFDDGYADNLHIARPLLERHGAAATVFVVAGAVGRTREFWWDELERLVLHTAPLPDRLWVTIRGLRHEWTLAQLDRHAVYHALWRLLQPLTENEREAVLDELRDRVGAAPRPRPDRRTLGVDELIALGDGDLVEIGAHTLTHPSLPMLGPSRQREEIGSGRRFLEEMLGRRVGSFAYPHGDHDKTTVSIVRDLGFACACTAGGGWMRTGDDVHRLPRVGVPDCDGDTFADRYL